MNERQLSDLDEYDWLIAMWEKIAKGRATLEDVDRLLSKRIETFQAPLPPQMSDEELRPRLIAALEQGLRTDAQLLEWLRDPDYPIEKYIFNLRCMIDRGGGTNEEIGRRLLALDKQMQMLDAD